MKKNKKGFTLLELLVVVLIIGILASIALPQYKMAVTKAKITSMFPLMRRFKDAIEEYYLQHGNYDYEEDANGNDALGVYWPSDWKKFGDDSVPCGGWSRCENEDFFCSNDPGVYIECDHNKTGTWITMRLSTDPEFPNKIICSGNIPVCKALGGKQVEGDPDSYILN